MEMTASDVLTEARQQWQSAAEMIKAMDAAVVPFTSEIEKARLLAIWNAAGKLAYEMDSNADQIASSFNTCDEYGDNGIDALGASETEVAALRKAVGCLHQQANALAKSTRSLSRRSMAVQ